jgi:hypothetical protein
MKNCKDLSGIYYQWEYDRYRITQLDYLYVLEPTFLILADSHNFIAKPKIKNKKYVQFWLKNMITDSDKTYLKGF